MYVLYVLDMAEIPTFQAQATVHADGTGVYAQKLAASIGQNLTLSVGGRRLALRPVRSVLAFPPGQAGLHTTRLEVVYSSAQLPSGTSARLDYRDGNYAGRIGWKEIIARAGTGARVDSFATRRFVPVVRSKSRTSPSRSSARHAAGMRRAYTANLRRCSGSTARSSPILRRVRDRCASTGTSSAHARRARRRA